MALLNPVRWSPMSCFPYGPSFNYISGKLELGNGESELVSRSNLVVRMTKSAPLYHEDQRVAHVASLIPAQVFTHSHTPAASSSDGSYNNGTMTNNENNTTTEFSTGWMREDSNLVCVITTHRLILYSTTAANSASNNQTSPIRQISYEGIESLSGEGGHGKMMSFSKGTPYKIHLKTRNFGVVEIEFAFGNKHVMNSSKMQRDEILSHVEKSIYLRFSKHDLNMAGRYVSTPNC